MSKMVASVGAHSRADICNSFDVHVRLSAASYGLPGTRNSSKVNPFVKDLNMRRTYRAIQMRRCFFRKIYGYSIFTVPTGSVDLQVSATRALAGVQIVEASSATHGFNIFLHSDTNMTR